MNHNTSTRLTGLRRLAALAIVATAGLLTVACGPSTSASTPPTSGSSAATAESLVGASGDEVIVVETPARQRLEDSQRDGYDVLLNNLFCPCEGQETESLAACLETGSSCSMADVAADTLGYHIEAGRPVPLALDQALKDLMAATRPQTFDVTDRPRVGSASAPIQIVTFEDFQCPSCRRISGELEQVVEAWPEDQVSLVFKHYPLGRHEHARTAALAAAAAQNQDGFWQLHDALFEHQSELDEARIYELAAEVGLDVARLEADMADPAIIARVDADIADGDAANLPGTPTIYINGVDAGEDMTAARLNRRIGVELAWLEQHGTVEHSARLSTPGEQIIAQVGGVPAQTAQGDPDAKKPDYPVLADVIPLLSDENQARLVKLAEAEICPCGETFESLDTCLRKDDGGCQLAVRVTKLAMRMLMEGETDGAISDLVVQEIEAARRVYEFDLAKTPYKGAEPGKGKITIVEFADFNCGYCAKASELVGELAKKYDGDVTFYFKNFPLNPSSTSPLAARAGLAAGEQGKFWEMHDLMFANQGDLSRESLLLLAEQIGLNKEKFTQALDDTSLATRVDSDRKEGEEALISGTPAFFIDGVRFNGSFDELEATIKDRLAE